MKREEIKSIRYDYMRWLCPKCKVGRMEISHLIEAYRGQIAGVPDELLLPDIEIKVLNTLFHSDRQMFSGELALELDCSAHQVGAHARNLVERALVDRRKKAGKNAYSLTQRAKISYFSQEEMERTRVN
jgi:hypothetical protein